MSVLTHELRFAPAAKKAQTAATRRSFWARVIDAIIESRTRRAEQEMSRHLGLVADILARTAGERPFAHPIAKIRAGPSGGRA